MNVLETCHKPSLDEVKIDELGWLHCPRCGFDYLHQGSVVVYDRSEDEPFTTKTRVGNYATGSSRSVPSSEAHNPSSRRHGLAINFACEGCGDGLQLTIHQHKGMTAVGWREVD